MNQVLGMRPIQAPETFELGLECNGRCFGAAFSLSDFDTPEKRKAVMEYLTFALEQTIELARKT